MATDQIPPTGKRMHPGSGWRLQPTKGKEREFKGTLLTTFNLGGKRFALFSVANRYPN